MYGREQRTLPLRQYLYTHHGLHPQRPMGWPVHLGADPYRHYLHRWQRRPLLLRQHLYSDYDVHVGHPLRRGLHRDAHAARVDRLHCRRQCAVLGGEHLHADNDVPFRDAVWRRMHRDPDECVVQTVYDGGEA